MKKLLLLVVPMMVVLLSCKREMLPDYSKGLVTVSESAVNAPFAAYKDTIQVQVNNDWMIEKPDSVDWVTLSPMSGSGNTDVFISIEKNASSDQRQTIITVSSGQYTKEIMITQAGKRSLSLSKTMIDTSYQSFKDSFQIITMNHWEISNVPEWITLSESEGNGITKIFLHAKVNEAEASRTGDLKVNTPYKSSNLKVVQGGNEIHIDTSGQIQLRQSGKMLDLSAGGKRDLMYIEGGQPILFPSEQSFSISLKMKDLPGAGTTQPRVFYWSNGTAYLGLLVDRNENEGKLGWFLTDKEGNVLREGPLGGSGSSAQNVSSSSVKDGKWHHVALVYNAEKAESAIYLDGKKEGEIENEGDFKGLDIENDFLVGDFTKAAANWNFGGYIDDLHFWNKALTKKEIYADAAGIRLPEDEDNLIAGWDFEKKEENKVPDITSHYDGVLMNDATLTTPSITDENSPYQLMADTMLFPHATVNGTEIWYYCAAITTLPNGDILIAADQRRGSPSDVRSNANISLAIRKSTDGGKSWSDMTILNADVGISDPSFIVDGNTGEIFIFGSAYKNGTHRLYYAKSEDNGDTWSNFEDRSNDLFDDDALQPGFQFIASGRGLYTRDGKMIQMMDNVSDANYLVISDDDGDSWHIKRDKNGEGLSPADESKIVELNDGTLMVNARATGGYRHIFASTDGGDSWTDWQDKQLPDPYCNAGFIAYTQKQDGFEKNRLLFSNCATSSSRTNLTVRVSYDAGQTWSSGRLISVPAGYSSLTILKDGTIGLAYCAGETGTKFARFTLKYLTNGQDSLSHSFD